MQHEAVAVELLRGPTSPSLVEQQAAEAVGNVERSLGNPAPQGHRPRRAGLGQPSKAANRTTFWPGV